MAAVVVSHGHAAELEQLLPALAPQVDELVVVQNVPEPDPRLGRVLRNPRPRSFAANANRGVAATSAELVLLANPDTLPEPDAVAKLVAFAAARPRCGVAGPQLEWEDGRWQPSRRRFPTVGATLVRRTPLRLLFPPLERQRAHYVLDERPTEPVEADWLLGAFLLLRRTMLDDVGGFDEGFRMYGEDIDLAYRASRAGWERWYVPAARVRHDYAAVIDRGFLTRRTWWHLRSMARYVRKHPGSLLAR